MAFFCVACVRCFLPPACQVGCFEIALSALFEDTPRNAFVEEFRPALWAEAKKMLPKSVFEYSRKALRKALVSLKSAYGPVGTLSDFLLGILSRLGQGHITFVGYKPRAAS